MSGPTGTGRAVPGPGRGAAWVREHGAHLADYAASHLGADRARAAVVAALAAGRTETAPEGVTVRGRLLAALRRVCRTAPGFQERYVPGSGPGMPDVLLIEQAWTIVDPLGTETLRLMYRHGLALEDVCHVLAMPEDEVGRLATRTQDLIETLVSGLDALTCGRRVCPELAPLVAAAFPSGQRARPPADPAGARTDLLSHMIRCSVCTRPINIRYTVPQMISHPPVAPLSAEERQRLADALPPEPARSPAGSPAPEPVRPRPEPAPGPSTPAGPPAPSAPDSPGRSGPGSPTSPNSRERSPSGSPVLPAPPAVALPAPRLGTTPYPPVGPRPASTAPGNAKEPQVTRGSGDGAGAGSGTRAGGAGDTTSTASTTSTANTANTANTTGGPDTAHGTGAGRETGTGSTTPSGLPPLPALPPRRARPRPPAAPPVTGHDTPLYDALLTQVWAREVLAQSEEVTATIPRQTTAPEPALKTELTRTELTRAEPATATEPVVITGQASVEMRDDAQIPLLSIYAEPDNRPDDVTDGAGIRVLEALSWAGTRIRNTTIKIVIIVVAGAAGTLTGMNLLGPAIEAGEPDSSLQSSATRAGPPRAGAPAEPRDGGLAARLRVPPVVTLDEFGQGSMVLTVSGEPLKWRISAPGLAVSPSDGTLRQGQTEVVTLRAHRIRNWCGNPASVTAPLTVHGPDDSITATVRWRTC
ncbi:hypothetical protein GCM10010517_00910 [Streptosporangium fragile]|uniref:Uncharacterized protein n=1 Tax=Streptosporangium fragile TaxID=46186 RepID=A0ABN3VPJ3_9ACTN